MKRERLCKSAGPKYPHVKVKLVGDDGNAFFIVVSDPTAVAVRANDLLLSGPRMITLDD